MRICLALIDLSAPYITKLELKKINEDNIQVNYRIGVSKIVDYTRVLYIEEQKL